jgi:hypothetical protein
MLFNSGLVVSLLVCLDTCHHSVPPSPQHYQYVPSHLCHHHNLTYRAPVSHATTINQNHLHHFCSHHDHHRQHDRHRQHRHQHRRAICRRCADRASATHWAPRTPFWLTRCLCHGSARTCSCTISPSLCLPHEPSISEWSDGSDSNPYSCLPHEPSTLGWSEGLDSDLNVFFLIVLTS